MARHFRSLVLTCCVSLFICGLADAAGSGAFRLEVPDAEAMGKGSAFVGEADNPSAVFYNPAGMTQLEGTQASLGFAQILPAVDFHNGSGTKAQMVRQSFNVPHFYVTSDLGTDKFAVGIGQTAFYGLGTAWADDSFARYNATESDIVNIDAMFTFAYKLTDKLSIGVSADHDYGTVNKSKKLQEAGFSDGDFQLKGESADWGYRLSTLFELNERHQFGLQYRSAIQKDYKGKAYLNNLNGVNAFLIGANTFEADLHAESEQPQSIVLGYSFTPDEKWRFNFDVEWMDWSSVEDEFIRWDTPLTNNQSLVLNNGNPASRDWNGVYSAAAGVEYNLNEKFTLRGGYFYHQSPIPESNFEANLPDSDSHSITTGLGYKFNDRLTADLAYAGMFYRAREIENNVAAGTINGKYRNFTNIITMTVGWKF